MTEPIPRGTWVEIHRIVLPAGERAPQTPEDTQRVPLEMRVKGFLVEPAMPGGEAEIETPAGRRLRGTLVAVNPGYSHGFGPPIPELLSIGAEVRARLRGSDLRWDTLRADRNGPAGTPALPGGPQRAGGNAGAPRGDRNGPAGMPALPGANRPGKPGT